MQWEKFPLKRCSAWTQSGRVLSKNAGVFQITYYHLFGLEFLPSHQEKNKITDTADLIVN